MLYDNICCFTLFRGYKDRRYIVASVKRIYNPIKHRFRFFSLQPDLISKEWSALPYSTPLYPAEACESGMAV